MGPSWSSVVDQRLEIDTEEIVFVTETGMLLRYAIPETGERVLPKHGPRWPLTRTVQGDWAVNDPATGQTRYFCDAPHAPGLALPRRDHGPQRAPGHLRLRGRDRHPVRDPSQRRLPN